MKQNIGRWLPIAVVVQFGVLAGSGQSYLFTGAETTITLNPGLYDITAYGAQGGHAYGNGNAGGLGAEMAGQFYFPQLETLTILGGGGGRAGVSGSYEYGGGGGGGGSFVVNGSTPLLIAGGRRWQLCLLSTSGGTGGTGTRVSVAMAATAAMTAQAAIWRPGWLCGLYRRRRRRRGIQQRRFLQPLGGFPGGSAVTAFPGGGAGRGWRRVLTARASLSAATAQLWGRRRRR